MQKEARFTQFKGGGLFHCFHFSAQNRLIGFYPIIEQLFPEDLGDRSPCLQSLDAPE